MNVPLPATMSVLPFNAGPAVELIAMLPTSMTPVPLIEPLFQVNKPLVATVPAPVKVPPVTVRFAKVVDAETTNEPDDSVIASPGPR